jgi:hypothetical protein
MALEKGLFSIPHISEKKTAKLVTKESTAKGAEHNGKSANPRIHQTATC